MCVPALRGQSIRPEDLLRHPDSHSLEEAPSSKKGKKKSVSEATGGGLTAAFHPSMTIMGVQPCVMVASAKGTVVKWNHVLERGTVVYGESCAHTEPSNPNLEPNTLMNADTDARTVKREFYEFHDCRILLLGFLEHGSLTMVTLDEKGHLAVWPYSADHFSGFMWHDPSETSTLDLTLDEFVASPQPAAPVFTFTTKEAADSHLVDFGELELKVPAVLPTPGCPRCPFPSALPPLPPLLPGLLPVLMPPRLMARPRLPALTRVHRCSTPEQLWDVHPDGRGGRREIYHPTADHDGASAIHELRRDHDGTLIAHEAQPCSHRRYRGTLKQALMTTSAAEIAMLVDHSKDENFRGRGATSGRAASRKLAVYLFNVSKGLFLASRVTHEISGVKHEPIFAVSPVFDSTGSDYAYILESHVVHVYSFMTGQVSPVPSATSCWTCRLWARCANSTPHTLPHAPQIRNLWRSQRPVKALWWAFRFRPTMSSWRALCLNPPTSHFGGSSVHPVIPDSPPRSRYTRRGAAAGVTHPGRTERPSDTGGTSTKAAMQPAPSGNWPCRLWKGSSRTNYRSYRTSA